MSTPINTYSVTLSTHDNEPNIGGPIEQDVPVAKSGTDQSVDNQEPTGGSSTEVPNLGEDARGTKDSNDTDGNASNTTMVDKVTEKIRGQSMVDSAPLVTEGNAPESSGQPSHSGSEGDSSDKETSRKRKLSSRSSVATETAARQQLKRPKESDVPEKEEDTEDIATVAPTKSPKTGQVFGFGAFASNKSPFLSAQSSSSSTPAPAPEVESRTASRTPEVLQNTEVTDSGSHETSTVVHPPPTPKPAFGGGFATFASVSPFQSANPPPNVNPASPPRESLAGPVRRSKSPVGKHQAFGQYSTGLSRFGAHIARKATQEDSDHPSGDGAEKGASNHSEFENILKTKGEFGAESDDNTTKVEIQQIQHNTGEEEDLTVFQTRAKLYTQDEEFAYKERGTGLLKLNVRRSDGEGARIVMRAEGVLRLLLNMALYPGLICELGPDPKFVKVAEITPNERKFHAIKVGNAKLAQELYDHLTENTPTKSIGFRD